MPHEPKVIVSPVLISMRGGSAAGCRCGLCEARRAIRLAQALHNKYGHGLAVPEPPVEFAGVGGLHAVP